ncbi:hypothetical protein MMC13_007736 [Lambiella insularis]|nr:hypothetical protein [Lambiella insularis]
MNIYSATSLPTKTTSSTPTYTEVLTAAPFAHHVCMEDNYNGAGRLLPTQMADVQSIEGCASACSGYDYFGIEYYRQCFCGNAYDMTQPGVAGCFFPCDGAYEFCGGSNAMDIYYNTLSVTSPPAPASTV